MRFLRMNYCSFYDDSFGSIGDEIGFIPKRRLRWLYSSAAMLSRADGRIFSETLAFGGQHGYGRRHSRFLRQWLGACRRYKD
jgi:hypothetical protein